MPCLSFRCAAAQRVAFTLAIASIRLDQEHWRELVLMMCKAATNGTSIDPTIVMRSKIDQGSSSGACRPSHSRTTDPVGTPARARPHAWTSLSAWPGRDRYACMHAIGLTSPLESSDCIGWLVATSHWKVPAADNAVNGP